MPQRQTFDLLKASAVTQIQQDLEANAAQLEADLAAVVADERTRRDVAVLLADTDFTYTPGTPDSVEAGEVIRTRAEGFSYEVAASSASDHHVTTAGGVKLYVLDCNKKLPFEAFGVETLDPTVVSFADPSQRTPILPSAVKDNSAEIEKAIEVATVNGFRLLGQGFYYASDTSLYKRLYPLMHNDDQGKKTGQITFGYRWPYDLDISSGGLVDQFTSPERFVVSEDGDLLVRVTYTGFLNAVRVQRRFGSLLRAETTEFINGETNAPDRFKRSISGDGLTKKAVFRIAKTADWFDTNADKLRFFFQDNSADRTVDGNPVQFEILKVEISWDNDKNVFARPPVNPLGFKGFAMRNVLTDAPSTNSRMLSSPGTVQRAIANISEYKRQTDADFIRFPLQYKGIMSHGTGSGGDPDLSWINRTTWLLDHCSRIGLNVQLCINHAFSSTSTFVTDEWIRAEDIDTPEKRQTRAEDAAKVLSYIVDHPAIKVIELENEVDVYQLGVVHDAADGTTLPELIDYYQKLAVELKNITAKPLALSFGGYRWINLIVGELFDGVIDYVDIHPYGISKNNPVGWGNPVIMSETNPDKLDAVPSVRYRSENVCIWADTINPNSGASGGDFGYTPTREATYRTIVPNQNLPFSAFVRAGAFSPDSLDGLSPSEIIPAQISKMPSGGGWGWNQSQDEWRFSGEGATIITSTANRTITLGVQNNTVIQNATLSATCDFTLSATGAYVGAVMRFVRKGAGANDLRIRWSGSNLAVLQQDEEASVWFDGTNWALLT
jgi:hypothetical protein